MSRPSPQTVLSLEARAKVNLSLDIVGKREDGYHLVRMVLQSVDLADELVLSASAETLPESEPVSVRLAVDDPSVPAGASNLVVQAALGLAGRLARTREGPRDGLRDGRPESRGGFAPVDARLVKKIPVGAGLGGGSADAAAALVGLCRLWGLSLSRDELALVGLDVGADVPFCLDGGTKLVEGVGEKLLPVHRKKPCWLVLANPGFAVATARVYAEYDVLAAAGFEFRQPDNDKLTAAIEAGAGPDRLAAHMANVLEPATLALHPELAELRDKLCDAGLFGVMMSGSGPTWIGLAEDEKAAREASRRVASRLPREVKVFACVSVDDGVIVKSDAGG